MPTLIEVLNRPAYVQFVNNNDFNGALAALTANTVVQPDSALWHWNGVIAALKQGVGVQSDVNAIGPNGLSLAVVATCRDILAQMPNGYLTLDALLTAGCQLSDTGFQTQVQVMEVTEPPEAKLILDAILAIGQEKTFPQWELEGLAQAPILQDVTTALTGMLTIVNQQAAQRFYQTVTDAYQNKISNWTSLSDLKTAVQEAAAS